MSDPRSEESAAEDYIKAIRRRGFAPSSVRVYATDISLFIRWYEEEAGHPFDAAALTTSDLQAYRGYLQNVAAKKPATINRRLQVVRSFCRWAHDQGLLQEEVGRHLKSIPMEKRTRPKGLDRKEVNAFLRAAKASGRGQARRNVAILQTLLQTGLRAGEVSRLLVRDVKIGKRKGSVTVQGGRSRKARVIPLNASARDAVDAYLDERKLPPDSPLFVSERGGALSVAGLEMVVHALARRADVERGVSSIQIWRHTFALGWLEDHPGDLVGLQRLLGHERIDATAVYCRPGREDLTEKLERSSSNVYGR